MQIAVQRSIGVQQKQSLKFVMAPCKATETPSSYCHKSTDENLQ